MMGKQHPSEPVTKSDKKMSERHRAHRDKVKKLETKGAPKEKILKESIKYNEQHTKEYVRANEKAKKELAKVSSRRGSSDGFIVSGTH